MTAQPRHARVKRKIGKTHGDRIFDAFNLAFWLAVLVVILYPLWLVLIASVSGAEALFAGKVWLWPVDFSLIGYEAILNHSLLLRSYLNSIIYTVAGTALSVIVTMMAGYSLSRAFAGKKLVSLYFVFTMFFTGGLIPQFLMNQRLGLYNTVTLMIIINCVSVWNLMIARTYISTSIPNELHEAAVVDGAGHFTYFFRIVLPLSGTIIAVLCIYYGVARWNDYFTALVYIRDETKYPLMVILRQLIVQATSGTALDTLMGFFGDGKTISEAVRKAEVVKYCCIVVSTVPVVLLYLQMQKFFVKGVTIGSLKG
ncbi:MAG: carbohydrate ABC transporter permease [Oscillospiraceae bacterium]|jgi:putative aldouronate transport system permease protein|nr:carbohydrate ABC transporter permease [Oscillospiraceae bacterium]